MKSTQQRGSKSKPLDPNNHLNKWLRLINQHGIFLWKICTMAKRKKMSYNCQELEKEFFIIKLNSVSKSKYSMLIKTNHDSFHLGLLIMVFINTSKARTI